MISAFFCLAMLASTIHAVPVNEVHARGLEDASTTSPTLSKRQDDWDVERNELTNVPGVNCKPITVIYARGTIELGNVGELVGPPFFNDLDDLIGAENIAVVRTFRSKLACLVAKLGHIPLFYTHFWGSPRV